MGGDTTAAFPKIALTFGDRDQAQGGGMGRGHLICRDSLETLDCTSELCELIGLEKGMENEFT